MFRKLTYFTLLLALLVAGCAPASTPTEAPVVPSQEAVVSTDVPATETNSAITLTDGLGREVTIASPSQKVVSLAPSNTEILFAVGAGSQTIGRDELSDYPEEAKAVESIGGSMGDFNVEAIVALQPDLVLAAGITSPDLIKSLEDLGLTVYTVANPATFEELYATIEAIGLLTGHEAEAKELTASLTARVAVVDEKIATLSTRIPVFYEIDGTDPAKPWTTGPGTFVDLLITRAGGNNIGSVLTDQWAQISSEELVKADPQVILLGDALYGVTIESVGQRPGWDVITAVKNNAIYPFNPDTSTRPGPRLIDALEEMAKLLHQDLFK